MLPIETFEIKTKGSLTNSPIKLRKNAVLIWAVNLWRHALHYKFILGDVPSFVMFVRLSVRPCLSALNISAPTGSILWLDVFKKTVEKIKVLLKSDKNNWYYTWRTSALILSRWILLKTRNVSGNSRETLNTHFMSNSFFFFRKSVDRNIKLRGRKSNC